MHECDRYSGPVDWNAVRHALRALRVQSKKGVRDIPGLNKSTVHRIENTKRRTKHAPDLGSVESILLACGSSLGRFFTQMEALQAHLGAPRSADILDALADEKKARQVIAFLSMNEQARAAVAASLAARDEAPAPFAESRRAPMTATRTKPPVSPRRSAGRGRS